MINVDWGLISLGLAIFGASEVWRRVPLVRHAKALAVVGQRAARGLSRSSTSDSAKERLAGVAACLSFRHSAMLGASLFAVISPLIAVLAIDNWLNWGVMAHLLDMQSRLIIAAMTLGIVGLRHVWR